MIKEAIEYVVSLGQRTTDRAVTETIVAAYDGTEDNYLHKINVSANGRTLGEALQPFRPAKIEVGTLTGFLDAIHSGLAGDETKLKADRIVHVEDYLTVSVCSRLTDKFGVRDKLITATYEPMDAFNFGEFYGDPAKFIIGIQVAFYQNDNSVALIKMASGLTAQSSFSVDDDGINQTLTMKQGEVVTKTVPVPPRIKLIPRRTFDEAAPVESEFLIRTRQSPGQTPMIALISVDGTKWQGECMRSIKTYLEKNLKHQLPILA